MQGESDNMEKKVQIGMLCEISNKKTIEYIERLLQWGPFFDWNCWK